MQFTKGHALIVGAGGDLPNTVNDAEGVHGVLVDPERCGYPAGQARLLTGSDAARADVLTALDTLAASTSADSTVVIYFSGHGYRRTTPDGTAYFLCPNGYDLNMLGKTVISGAEFAARLKAIPAQKLLLLLDCCHADGLDTTKAPAEVAKVPVPKEVEQALAEGVGRIGIASSRAGELSFAGTPYSAFTVALLESLSGVDVAKQDGLVYATDLALHAAKVVPQRTKDRQNPVLNLKAADNFPVAYYAAGEVKPKGLPFAVPPQLEPDAGAWAQAGQTVVHTQININAPAAFVQHGWNVGQVVQVQGDATFGRARAPRKPKQ
jgi:Caspase domain